MVLLRHSGTWTDLCASSLWAGARWLQHCVDVGQICCARDVAPRGPPAPLPESQRGRLARRAHRPRQCWRTLCRPVPAQVVGVLKGYDALLNLVRAPPSSAPARPSSAPPDPRASPPDRHVLTGDGPVQVLDETKEFLKDPDDPYKLLDESRPMGLTVCRGTSVMLVCPTDGYEEIENPFLQDEEEDQPLG